MNLQSTCTLWQTDSYFSLIDFLFSSCPNLSWLHVSSSVTGTTDFYFQSVKMFLTGHFYGNWLFFSERYNWGVFVAHTWRTKTILGWQEKVLQIFSSPSTWIFVILLSKSRIRQNSFSNILSFRRCCDVARFVSQVIPFFHPGTADQPPSVWTKMSTKNVIFKKVCKDKSVSWLSFLSKIRTVSVFLKGFSRLKGADSHVYSWLSAEMLSYN